MSKLLSCLCCCCPCLGKEKRTHRKSRNTKMNEKYDRPSTLDNKLTQIFEISDTQFRSLTDILKEQRFEVYFDQRIGKGSFGQVFKAKDVSTHTDIACKRITFSNGKPEQRTDLTNELYISTEVKTHQNIIKIHKHFIVYDRINREDNCYIFMELANGGTLLDKLVDQGKRFTESQAKKYFAKFVMDWNIFTTRV